MVQHALVNRPAIVYNRFTMAKKLRCTMKDFGLYEPFDRDSAAPVGASLQRTVQSSGGLRRPAIVYHPFGIRFPQSIDNYFIVVTIENTRFYAAMFICDNILCFCSRAFTTLKGIIER